MKSSLTVFTLLASFLLFSCGGSQQSFQDQIEKDVYEKIASGYCESKQIAKDAQVKNLQVGEITPIGETGMIDVSLEFDIVNKDGSQEHMTQAMLYLEQGNGGRKMLAIFCDYDYRKNN